MMKIKPMEIELMITRNLLEELRHDRRFDAFEAVCELLRRNNIVYDPERKWVWQVSKEDRYSKISLTGRVDSFELERK